MEQFINLVNSMEDVVDNIVLISVALVVTYLFVDSIGGEDE